MDLKNIRENKGKMILQFSIPSIIAMLLTSLITVADGYFMGNYVGEEGLAAVNLGLPIVYLYLAVGLMFSVGGMVISGMQMGEGELKKCNQVFMQTLVTTVTVLVILSCVVGLGFQLILWILHAEGVVAEYFTEYYRVMLLVLPVMITNSALGVFIRGEGSPQYFMLTNLLNVILNIVFDYVFCKFGFGAAAIAFASLVAAVITLLCDVLYFFKLSKVYRFGRFSFDKKVFIDTVLNGSSEFIGEMASCVSMFAYNYVIMRRFGVDGVTSFTIVGYLCYTFEMIVTGFGTGIFPLISFVYGAGDTALARDIRKKTNQLVFGAGVAMVLLLLFAGESYSAMFVKSETVRNMVQLGTKIFMISFLFCGINQICSFYFTSIGKAKESAVISSARGLVLLLICIFTLPVWFGMTGVWLVAPVTEMVTLFICAVYVYRDSRSVQERVDYATVEIAER